MSFLLHKLKTGNIEVSGCHKTEKKNLYTKRSSLVMSPDFPAVCCPSQKCPDLLVSYNC